jgi:regulator of sirC expression with transglutaminase-like and TPR domain
VHVGDLIDRGWQVLNRAHAVHLGLERVLLQQHSLSWMAIDAVDHHLDRGLASARAVIGQVNLHALEVCHLQQDRAKASEQVKGSCLHAGT